MFGARVIEASLARVTGRGLTSLGRVVPLLGGVVSGAVDAATCKLVGNAANSVFLDKR
jgi:hypothetical protein